MENKTNSNALKILKGLEKEADRKFLRDKLSRRMKIASCTPKSKKTSEIYHKIMGFVHEKEDE